MLANQHLLQSFLEILQAVDFDTPDACEMFVFVLF